MFETGKKQFTEQALSNIGMADCFKMLDIADLFTSDVKSNTVM